MNPLHDCEWRVSRSRLRRQRQGWTLIEAVLTATLTTLAIFAMSDWSIRMLQINRRIEQHSTARDTLDRLAVSLASDTRESQSWSAEDRKFLGPGGREVHYLVQGNVITRSLRDGDSRKLREHFVLPESYSIVWPVDGVKPSKVEWNLTWNEKSPVTTRIAILDAWRVETTLGSGKGIQMLDPVDPAKAIEVERKSEEMPVDEAK